VIADLDASEHNTAAASWMLLYLCSQHAQLKFPMLSYEDW